MENHEKNIALMEANMIAGEDEYFAARPKRDSIDGRLIYQGGFKRAWRIAQAAAEDVVKLRAALIPLANAHSPAEREQITDEDVKTAQVALYGEQWSKHGLIG